MFQTFLLFRFSLGELLKSVPPFISLYFCSRRFTALFGTGLLLGLLLVPLFIANWADLTGTAAVEHGQHLQKLYADFIDQKKFEAADLAYLKAAKLATGNSDGISYHYASLLYENSSPESTQRKRALSLLSSLAPPPAVFNAGYAPAHERLATHYRLRAELTFRNELLSLYHSHMADPTNVADAIAFAKRLYDFELYDRAISVLVPHPNSVDALRLLTRCYVKHDNPLLADTTLSVLANLLGQQMFTDPTDVETRKQLSNVLVAQGQILQAILTLSDGLAANNHPELADLLIDRLAYWMTLLSKSEKSTLIGQLATLMSPETPPPDTTSLLAETENLTLSDGRELILPTTLVRLHGRLLSDDRLWVSSVLSSSERAAEGNFYEAISLLRAALLTKPSHPVIRNNLAWMLCESTEDLSDPAERARRLTEARSLIDSVISEFPERLSYQDTLGTIAARQGDWLTAVNAWDACVQNGYRLTPLLGRLKEARRCLSNLSDPVGKAKSLTAPANVESSRNSSDL